GRRGGLEGKPVALSKKEFALLRALAAEPTRVFTREELLRGVWGFQSLGTTRTLDAESLVAWTGAALGAAAAALVCRSLRTRMEAVARACHELRGPLSAVRLGLELGSAGGELTPARLRAIELELGRASLALDDLAAAR